MLYIDGSFVTFRSLQGVSFEKKCKPRFYNFVYMINFLNLIERSTDLNFLIFPFFMFTNIIEVYRISSSFNENKVLKMYRI